MKATVGAILIMTFLSGCAGTLRCDWQTQDERYEEVIQKAVKAIQQEEKPQ